MLVDRREAAKLLGVSAGTIDNLRRRGELPSVKIAARRLFDPRDLVALVDARKTMAPTIGTPGAAPGGGIAP